MTGRPRFGKFWLCLALLVLFAGQTAQARMCRSVLASDQMQIHFVADAGVPEQFVKQAEALIASLAGELSPYMKLPKEVTFEIPLKGEKGVVISTEEFKAIVPYFRISRAPNTTNEITKNPQMMLFTLIHEFGHLVYFANLPKDSNWRFRDIPYQEVFADTLTVIKSGDPRAMTRALYHPGRNTILRENALLRDFSLKISPSQWDNPYRHLFLNPIRSFLWHHYLKHPFARKQKGPVLRSLLDVIFSELRQRDQEGWSANWPTPEILNQRVIEGLERKLKL